MLTPTGSAIVAEIWFVYLVWMNCLPSWLDLEMCSFGFVVLRKNTFVEAGKVPSMFFAAKNVVCRGHPVP